jgi:hypothetical protein
MNPINNNNNNIVSLSFDSAQKTPTFFIFNTETNLFNCYTKKINHYNLNKINHDMDYNVTLWSALEKSSLRCQKDIYSLNGLLFHFLQILSRYSTLNEKFDLIANLIGVEKKFDIGTYLELFSQTVLRNDKKTSFFEIILKSNHFEFLNYINFHKTNNITAQTIVDYKKNLSTISECLTSELQLQIKKYKNRSRKIDCILTTEENKLLLIKELFFENNFTPPSAFSLIYNEYKKCTKLLNQNEALTFKALKVKALPENTLIFGKSLDEPIPDNLTSIYNKPPIANFPSINNNSFEARNFSDIFNDILEESSTAEISPEEINSYIFSNTNVFLSGSETYDVVAETNAIQETIEDPLTNALLEDVYKIFIDFIEKTKESKNSFLNAMFKNKGKCEVFLGDANNKNLTKLNKEITSSQLKDTTKKTNGDLFNHFGVKASQSPTNHLISDVNILSHTFRKYLIPAIYAYKKKQFEYLVHTHKNEVFSFEEKEISKIPGILLAQDDDRAIVLPCMLAISGLWSSIDNQTNQGFNEHISAMEDDRASICLNFLQERVCPNIQLEENGTIYLDCDQLKVFKELMTTFHLQHEFPLRVLPFSGRLKLDPAHILENEEEIIPLSLCEAYENTMNENEKEEKVGSKRSLSNINTSQGQPFLKKTKIDPFLKNRQTTIRGKGFRLEEDSVTKSIDENEKEEGKLIPLTGQMNYFSGSRVVLENFWDIFLTEIKSTQEKIHSVKAKQNAHALKPLELPIFEWLNTSVTSTRKRCIPLIRTLKKYQKETLKKIDSLLIKNMTPLVSLEMGLGKTPIYTNIIANLIAQIDEGITVILVPAATRGKTIKELMWGISEAQSTAFLHYSRNTQRFQKLWRSEAVRIAINIPKQKQILQTDFSLFDTFKPLLMVADKFDLTDLKTQPKVYRNFEITVRNYFRDAAQEHLDSLSKTLNNSEPERFTSLKSAIQNIKSVKIKEGECFFEPPVSFEEFLTEISAIANLSFFSREELSNDLAEHVNEEECERLIQFPLSSIVDVYKMPNQTEAFKTQLDNKHSVIVLGYKAFANLMKDEEAKSKLFNAKHRLLVTDEAQNYHTETKQSKDSQKQNINDLMHEYAIALKKQDALNHTFSPILTVTATPYENNPRELFSLLNISNNRLCEQNKTTIQPFPASTVSALMDAQNRTVIALMDMLETPDLDLLKQKFIHSFAQWRMVSQVLEKIVFSKRVKDADVIEDWLDQVTVKEKKLILSESPELNIPLKTEIDKIIQKTYGKLKNSDANLQGVLISASSQILGKYLDVNFTGKLTEINRTDLIRKIEKALDSYLSGNMGALNDHQYVLDFITDKATVDIVNNSKKLIIVKQNKIEDDVLELIIRKCFPKKTPIRFGDNDMERKKATDTLTYQNDTILILPLKAGGVGLNLGFVDDMIMLGKHWNPAIFKQAVFRFMRVGRSGPRRLYVKIRKNMHEKFISCIFTQKTKHAKFLISKSNDLKKSMDLYGESLLQHALRSYLLKGKNVEDDLRTHVASLLNQISEEDILKAIDQLMPLEHAQISLIKNVKDDDIEIEAMEIEVKEAKNSNAEISISLTPPPLLNPNDYYRIPIRQSMEKEFLCKMAAYLNNVKNGDPVFKPLQDFFTFVDTSTEEVKRNGFEKIRKYGWREIENHQDIFAQLESYHVNFYLYNQPNYTFSYTEKKGAGALAVNLFERKLPNGNIYYEILMSKDKVNECFRNSR